MKRLFSGSFFISIIVLLLFLFIPSIAITYDASNYPVHQWIALDNSWILWGTRMEDDEIDSVVYANCCPPTKGCHPYCNHFWNSDGGPDDGLYACWDGYWEGINCTRVQWNSAYRRAQTLWDTKVIPGYTSGGKLDAYYWLGRIAHLLADVSVPAHVHKDIHIPILNPDSYETFTETNYIYWDHNDANQLDLLPKTWNLSDLFWNLAQRAQYFPSNNSPGDKANADSNWFSGWPEVTAEWNLLGTILDEHCMQIAERMIPLAIQYTGALYRLFYYEFNIGIEGPDTVKLLVGETFSAMGKINGSPVTSWEWDFDYDGINFNIDAIGQSVTHIFSQWGEKKIALRAVTPGQEPVIITKNIYVLSSDWISLPRTGQTTCYDSSGNVIACPGTGQDGDTQSGAAWPSPRFTNPDGTVPITGNVVLDQFTGLMWTKNAYLTGLTKTWQEALDYIAGMNAGTYQSFDYTDWVLPNINELESLINAGEANPATWLNNQGFDNVQSYYMSSTTTATESTEWIWVVDMRDGSLTYTPKNGYANFWPVRWGQSGSLVHSDIWKTGQTTIYAPGDDGDLERGVAWPDPRFDDHGDGTVTDNLTGLVWTKDTWTPGPDSCSPATHKTWQQGLDYCKCLNNNNYLGFNDWRLPNRKELLSLVDRSKGYPALPTGHPFINVWSDTYWSSTTDANFTDEAWLFYTGKGSVWSTYKSGSLWVWPVRGEMLSSTDTTPPTPNPMTWATPPYAASSTSISMVATTANDTESPPVSYYFDYVDSPTGGSGGADSGWQSSTSYTNMGLQPNHRYGYQAKARDSASTPNETSYSSVVYRYTQANPPGVASFSNVTQTCIRANWTANGNRSGTEYWCENTTQGINSGWTTNTYWDSAGLNCGTSYNFRVKARNGDGTETGWVSLGNQSTAACLPSYGISVISPIGGETWVVGTTQTVRWSYTGNPGSSVKIELLKGGMFNGTITSSASVGRGGAGSYNWRIPSDQALGADYRIRVTSTSNSAYTDSSDSDFSIVVPPPISVLSPNGGETWAVGTRQTISWSCTGNVGSSVKVELLKGGVVNRTITSSASVGRRGTGSYRWRIPSDQTPGADYKIRVTSTSNSGYTDISDNNFTIK
jgi:hypothetical protein